VKSGGHFVVADGNAALERWMESLGRKMPAKIERAAFLMLDAPLYPQDYPHDAGGLQRLAQRAGPDGLQVLTGMLRPGKEVSVVVAFEHEANRILLGIVLDVPRSVPGGFKKRIPIWDGFREDTVPGQRVLQVMAAARVPVQKCAVAEVHRRALIARTTGQVSPNVANASVAVVGCGSLGGAVALLLAQSGVARLRLIDPDSLSWQNVGRHALPGSFVGQKKAIALASHLRSYIPDLEVVPIAITWQQAWKEDPALFDSMDLIVCATGEWTSEGFLNQLSKQGLEVPPAIFAWLEAYGVAGHAVLVLPRGGCLRCLTNEHGEFDAHVAHFPEGKPLVREAACGVAFQPFGAVTVMPAASLVTNAALEALRGETSLSEHRAWVGPRRAFDAVNAMISETWFERVNADGFERIHRIALMSQPGCPHCQTP
jgi:sulfur-carrier protein adenylyltransferase/sulfurtransferase